MSEISGNDCPLLPPAVSQSLILVAQPPKEPPAPPVPVSSLCNENINHHGPVSGVPLPSTNGNQPPLPMPPPPQIPPPPPYTPPHLSQVPPPPSSPPPANSSPKAGEARAVCRDFLRGVCYRESTCKYLHDIIKDSIKFCHDFQNKTCLRQNCKFIHCTNAEEQLFNKTGELSQSILDKYFKNPICKDYIAGLCPKGDDCPYRHQKDEEKIPANILARPPPPPPPIIHHPPMPRGIPRPPPPSSRPMTADPYLPGSGSFQATQRVYPPNISMPPPGPPNWRNQWIPKIKEEKEDWSTPPPAPRTDPTGVPTKRMWNGNEAISGNPIPLQPAMQPQAPKKSRAECENCLRLEANCHNAELQANVVKITNSKNVILEQLIELMKKPDSMQSSSSMMMGGMSPTVQSQHMLNTGLPQQQMMQQSPYHVVQVAPSNSQSHLRLADQNHTLQLSDGIEQQNLAYCPTTQQLQNGSQGNGQTTRSLTHLLHLIASEYGDLAVPPRQQSQQQVQQQQQQQQQQVPHHHMMSMGQQAGGHMMGPQSTGSYVQSQLSQQLSQMQQPPMMQQQHQQNPYAVNNMIPPH